MKERYFTKLDQCFEVPFIATIYHFKGLETEPKTEPYDFWHFLYVCDGEIETETSNGKTIMKRGDVAFRAPGEVHKVSTSGFMNSEVIILSFICESPLMEYFHEKKILSLSHEERDLLLKTTAMGVKLFDVIADNSEQFVGCKLKDTATKASLQLLKNSIERLLLMLYVRTNDFGIIEQLKKESTRKKYEELIGECIDFMRENITEMLTTEQIARRLSVSTSTLKKAFSDEMGKGIMHYFSDMKLEKAKEMMEDGTSTFSMIADALGYSSPNHFYCAFKAKTGMSPSAYSKAHFGKKKKSHDESSGK
ncbi:MAG: helix-turn-helix transcriptional regulator [Clostridia bacterium]|nr:helix-turn-helix transcriptional regulator [Clostridia bacterium]